MTAAHLVGNRSCDFRDRTLPPAPDLTDHVCPQMKVGFPPIMGDGMDKLNPPSIVRVTPVT